MSEHIFRHWPPQLPELEQRQLLQHATDWSLAHGLLMKSADSPSLVHHAPFSLFPSPFPRDALILAQRLQPIFNRLIHAISQDWDFLDSIFAQLSNADPFTARLYKLWLDTRSCSPRKRIWFGIHRADYMLHQQPNELMPILQQVEINTIAASFSSLSGLVGQLHRYLYERTHFYNELDRNSLDIVPSAMPENSSLIGIADGIGQAWKLFYDTQAVVIMVVQPNERNVFDQRWIEYRLHEKFGIRLYRKTLTELADELSIMDEHTLKLNYERTVAVVYFRSGYGPNDYPSEKEWNARGIIERSNAIACPSVVYHLTGAKKVQQVLTMPGNVEKFIGNPEDVKLVRSCFTGIFPLDSTLDGLKSFDMGLKNPEKYVLKPQREGGGNNFYGPHVREKLNSMTAVKRSGYVLMERILPPPYKNVLVRQGVASELETVSELGIYGVFISDDAGKEVENSVAGQLLRTKSVTTDEGGVAAGFAVIDSPVCF